MTQNFASGRLSVSVCDRCGLKYPYQHLRQDGDIPGLWVCSQCWDRIDPYKLPARQPDAFTLSHPRPDVSVAEDSPLVPFLPLLPNDLSDQDPE